MAVFVSDPTLSEWLDRAITRKGITQGAVATYCEISTAAVSDWRAGRRIPDPKYVWKLAKYFGEPVEAVMRIAGHLPPVDPNDTEEGARATLANLDQELVAAWPSLHPDEQDLILQQVRLWLSRRPTTENPEPAPGR